MTDRTPLHYGKVPVPYAALWSAEADKMHVGTCPHVNMPACMDVSDRGNGRPIFGKPHMTRQRELIIGDLCDLCAKPLANRTKVSLSHAKPVVSGGTGLAILQVEPLLHKDCAAICIEHCPSLKRDIKAGTLFVRHVLKHRHQVALMTSAAVQLFTKNAHEYAGKNVAGHAKVELLRWKEKDLQWLMN